MVAPQPPYPQGPPGAFGSSGPPGPLGPPGPPSGGGGGTSKVVPVVVSAGLAVGVFAGLLFGLGTGEVAAQSRRIGPNGEILTFDVGTEEYEGPDKVALTPDAGPVTPDGGVLTATPDAGVVDAAPTIKLAHVTFTVTPPGTVAKITADGKPVEGELEVDITGGAKDIEIVAKAAGFRDFKKKITVDKDGAQTIDLVKRPVVPNNGNGGRRPNNGGGKIDI